MSELDEIAEMVKTVSAADKQRALARARLDRMQELNEARSERMRELEWEFCCQFVSAELGPFTPAVFRSSTIPADFCVEKGVVGGFHIWVPGRHPIFARVSNGDSGWRITMFKCKRPDNIFATYEDFETAISESAPTT